VVKRGADQSQFLKYCDKETRPVAGRLKGVWGKRTKGTIGNQTRARKTVTKKKPGEKKRFSSLDWVFPQRGRGGVPGALKRAEDLEISLAKKGSKKPIQNTLGNTEIGGNEKRF